MNATCFEDDSGNGCTSSINHIGGGLVLRHNSLSIYDMGAFSSLVLLVLTASLVVAVNPGSYLITNVQFPEQTVVGTDVAREGMPISTFNVMSSDFP